MEGKVWKEKVDLCNLMKLIKANEKAIKQGCEASNKTSKGACGRFLGLAKLLTGTLKIIVVEFIKVLADSPRGAVDFLYMFVKALEDDSNAFCEKAKEDDREMIKRSMPAFEKIYKKYNKIIVDYNE